jgi:hypothetical protein
MKILGEISVLSFIYSYVAVCTLRSVQCVVSVLVACIYYYLITRLTFINILTPELNPSAQRCLTRFFFGYFASLTVNFVNICVKNQQMQQLVIQFINYVW